MESQNLVNEGLEEERDATLDAGDNRREKIEIPGGMSPEELMEKYNVSRATAYRALERGWLFMNYQQRVIDVDNDWADSHIKELKESARIGSAIAIKSLNLTVVDLRPFEFDDLVSSACVRLVELSGHPNRDNPKWRNAVAKNAALHFIDSQITSVGIRFKEKRFEDYK